MTNKTLATNTSAVHVVVRTLDADMKGERFTVDVRLYF